MKQERSVKELLEVMLNNKKLFAGGLCSWVWFLYYYDVINLEEYMRLDVYIQENRPSIFSSKDAFKHMTSLFYWKKGNIEPRIEWINKHIKKLSK